ncbi:MAG: glycosyltransferase family 39 protein [Phycisphaerae bacterium]|nr:glycosyltransferase family 39 protein [Phycisphaerae bacterium]NNF42497.1 O-GlcNAc transferase [Phycisphaerales bacterium]
MTTLDTTTRRGVWPWRLAPLVAFGIVLLTLLAYTPALDGGFIWDDDDYLTQNPLVQMPGGLARIWVPGATRQYYPMVFTTFWIEYRLWGLDPAGYRIVNVLLHAASALVLWRVLRRIGVPGAALIGAAFALHPVHVESVAWITERKNVLSGFLYLLAALAYLRFDDQADPPARPWAFYGAALVAFAGALLAKSVTCSLPAALVLVMLFQRRPLTARRLLPLVPLFAIGLVAALNTAHLERVSVGAVGAAFDADAIDRTLVASRALLFYPTKILWPWPLMFIYPRWSIDPADLVAWVPFVVVGLVAAIALVLFARGRRGPFVALAFYAGTVFPALGFVNVYPHQFSWVADHFQYLASIGILALVLAPAVTLLTPRRRVGLLGGLVLVPLFAITWVHAGTFRDAESVWRSTLVHNDEAWIAHNNLSTILLRRAGDALSAGDRATASAVTVDARQHARRATEIKPDYHVAHANLAEALRLEGEFDTAVTHQREAIRLIEAEMAAAQVQTPPDFLVDGWLRLGRLQWLRGELADAAAAYRRAVAARNNDISARSDLATLLVRLGDLPAAGTEFENILAVRPDHYTALGTLAALRERDERYAEANDLYHRAVTAARTMPQRVESATRLLRFRTSCPDPQWRDLVEATALAEQLVQFTRGRDPAALGVLASVHAASARWEDAIRTAEQAVALADRTGPPALRERLRDELSTYRANAAGGS